MILTQIFYITLQIIFSYSITKENQYRKEIYIFKEIISTDSETSCKNS